MWTGLSRNLIAATVLAMLVKIVANAQDLVSIGIVREDGHLMPITLVTDQLFEDPPLPVQTFDNGEPMVPDVPADPAHPLVGHQWSLVTGRGRKPIHLRTLETLSVRMPYCNDQIMWRTSLARPRVKEGYAPIRKLGIAVGGAPVEFPEEVGTQPDAPSRQVARRIVSLFLTKEKARLAKEQGQYAVSMAPGSPPVVIRQLQRHAIGGVTIYYFEATKALKLSDGSVSPDAGLATGWIVDSASALKDYETVYKVNDDAYKENERAIVRGVVPYRGKALWLLEWHGWESEYYTLHDWPSGVTRLTVNAYAC